MRREDQRSHTNNKPKDFLEFSQNLRQSYIADQDVRDGREEYRDQPVARACRDVAQPTQPPCLTTSDHRANRSVASKKSNTTNGEQFHTLWAVRMRVGGTDTKVQETKRWWHSALLGRYESLTLTDQVQPVDLIVVMAGRMERKQYGLHLLRAGLTPHLILSVGRFEVSKMKCLELSHFEELLQLRDKTQPDERHFFVDVDSSGVRSHKVKLARWNTYGEALALRDCLKDDNAQRVMVVSTDIHLRRVAFTFSKVFRDMPVEFLYCPVPPMLSSVKKDRWWTRRDDRRYVLKEIMKLAGYRAILSMPAWVARWLMRLETNISPSAV